MAIPRYLGLVLKNMRPSRHRSWCTSQRTELISAGVLWREKNSHSVLVGMLSSIVFMENNMRFLKKSLEIELPYGSAIHS